MKKQNKMAKIHYDRVDDRYILFLRNNDDEEWGFSCSAKCRAAEGGDGATDFIHYSFLREVLQCAALGYKIIET